MGKDRESPNYGRPLKLAGYFWDSQFKPANSSHRKAGNRRIQLQGLQNTFGD